MTHVVCPVLYREMRGQPMGWNLSISEQQLVFWQRLCLGKRAKKRIDSSVVMSKSGTRLLLKTNTTTFCAATADANDESIHNTHVFTDCELITYLQYLFAMQRYDKIPLMHNNHATLNDKIRSLKHFYLSMNVFL